MSNSTKARRIAVLLPCLRMDALWIMIVHARRQTVQILLSFSPTTPSSILSSIAEGKEHSTKEAAWLGVESMGNWSSWNLREGGFFYSLYLWWWWWWGEWYWASLEKQANASEGELQALSRRFCRKRQQEVLRSIAPSGHWSASLAKFWNWEKISHWHPLVSTEWFTEVNNNGV